MRVLYVVQADVDDNDAKAVLFAQLINTIVPTKVKVKKVQIYEQGGVTPDDRELIKFDISRRIVDLES